MKINKYIKLLFLAIALTSCNKVVIDNADVESDLSTETQQVSFALSLNSLYQNDAATKAGGDNDIPYGYDLVARMQVYLLDSDGNPISEVPLTDDVEYVTGNELDDDQLSDLSVFNNVRLSMGESYEVFTQFYFEPVSDSEEASTPVYIYDATAKTYTRNYEYKSLGNDAEDFYASEKVTLSVAYDGTITCDGELVDYVTISASRKVTKLNLYVSSLYDLSSDADGKIIETQLGVESDDETVSYNDNIIDTLTPFDDETETVDPVVSLVYNEFLVPSYNYYLNVIVYANEVATTVKMPVEFDFVSGGVMSDYLFVPDATDEGSLVMSLSVDCDGNEYLKRKIYEVYSSSTSIEATLDEQETVQPIEDASDEIESQEEELTVTEVIEYTPITVTIKGQNLIYTVVSGAGDDGSYLGFDVYNASGLEVSEDDGCVEVE